MEHLPQRVFYRIYKVTNNKNQLHNRKNSQIYLLHQKMRQDQNDILDGFVSC